MFPYLFIVCAAELTAPGVRGRWSTCQKLRVTTIGSQKKWRNFKSSAFKILKEKQPEVGLEEIQQMRFWIHQVFNDLRGGAAPHPGAFSAENRSSQNQGADLMNNVIWCDMMWYDVIWCDMMWYDVIWNIQWIFRISEHWISMWYGV